MSGPKIEVSTHDLAQMTERALDGKIGLEMILTTWHEIGNVIKQQFLQKKAVRLSSFGTFGLSVRGDPIFTVAPEFASQFKLKQRQVAPDNIPTAALNCSQVGSSIGASREAVETIYTKWMTCLGRVLCEGRSVVLTIHRVAEINISRGELSCDFIPDFLMVFAPPSAKPAVGVDKFKKAAQKTSTMLTATKTFEQGIRQDREYDQRRGTSLAIGGHEEVQRAGVRGRPASAGRSRNPITGAGQDSPAIRGRPNSASGGGRPISAPRGDFRRPMSASSQSTSHTALASPRAGPGGLTRQALDRHSRAQPATPTMAERAARVQEVRARGVEDSMDARRIAAKALDVGDVIVRVRAKIVQRGGSNGIRSISKLLAIMDDNGDKRLSKDELKYGLRDYGIDLTPTELEQVFMYFDRDRNGFIDTTEFLVGIRGDLPERRRRIVRMAFDALDRDGSGEVSVDEVLQAYDLKWHPEVRAGKMTVQEAARDFMKQWDRLEADGIITVAEFEDYYKEVSASIDDDDYFELMIRNAWRIAGGEGAAANTANRRVLVTNKDGSQSVQTVRDELGMRGGDVDDVRRRLARQGVAAEQIDLHGAYEDMTATKRGRNPPPSLRPSGAVGGRPQAPAQGLARSQGRPVAREVWQDAPHPGDQSIAPEPRDDGSRRRSPRPQSCGFDPFEVLHRLLYSPPVSLEHLCIKLQVSSVSTNPRIAQGAFTKRLSTLDPSLDRGQLAAVWKVLDPKNMGSAEAQAIHALLGDRFGKDKSAQKNPSVLDRVIKKILERCGEGAGIKGLQRALAIMDDSGDRRLTREELKTGLQDYGIELNLRELDDVFTFFDRDRNGTIDIDELLVGIRGDLNPRRQRMVQMAFALLDKDGSGVVTVEEMMQSYDFRAHPEVVAGKKSLQEAAREFMRQWDRRDADGLVSYEEFEDYYKGVSASIDGDDYFELMIRNAWRIAGGEGAAANTANRRVLVTNKDGSQSVQTVRDELGMRGGDVDDVRRRLARQGVAAEQIDLHGAYEDMSKARTSRGPLAARGGQRPGAPRSSHAATMPAAAQPQRQGSQFDRNVAAVKLAAAYRGRLGRKQAEQEKRKLESQRRAEEDERIEQSRPRPREITRPKGKSYIGF